MEFKEYIINGNNFIGLKDANLMTIYDTQSKLTETIIGVKGDSLLITQTKRTKHGINCTQWIDTTNNVNKARFDFTKINSHDSI